MATYLIVHKDTPIHIGKPNGGAEMASLYLARYLAASGEEVALAARLEGNREKEGTLEYIDLGASYDVEKALERVRSRGPYHLISNGHVLALFLSRHDPLCLSRILHTGERSGAAGMGMEVVTSVSDFVACVSHAQREMFIQEGASPEKAQVVYNGVDLERFTAGDVSQRNWNKLVFAGALVQDKGIHVLIEAFAHLKQKFPELSLDVFGSAKLWHRDEFLNQSDLEAKLPGLKFHGSVQGEVLARAYQSAGICVVPSIWFEPFGMVASDALATGCPVVTFNVGGPAEVVQHGVNGLVVNDISTDGLTRALDQLLSNREELTRLAAGALRERERFSWEKAVGGYKQLCEKAAARRPAAESQAISVPSTASGALPKLGESPKISVVTVSFNQAEFIRDTIESVLAQDYENFEHIIVDGGSTDGTLEILKSYPHLKWTSEPDEGQSDALNKGFSRAEGDIIVWLNSDDWLAPGCFTNIAPALREYGTVIAPAAKTDRQGKVEEIVPNTARHWADLLKFWVPYAWFAQTSIFFRKDFLESVRLPNGNYLDQELHFTMDIDLWIRMAKKQPFLNRIDHLCSYYRMYEENKTGEDGPAAQRECSRLFRRHCHMGDIQERRFSVLLPMQSTSDDILPTLQSLLDQGLPDVEVLLIAQGEDIDPKVFRKIAGELEAQIAPFSIRPVFAPGAVLLEALNAGIESATGRFTVFLQPGDLLGEGYFAQLERDFVYDWVGVLVPVKDNPELANALGEGTNRASVDGICTAPIVSPIFAARTCALRDLEGFKNTASPLYGVRELLLRALYKSWHVILDEQLDLKEHGKHEQELERLPVFESYVVAKLIADLHEESLHDPFFEAKLAHGNAVAFSSQLAANAREILQSAPENWLSFSDLDDEEELRSVTEQYPHFAPGWFFLAGCLKKKDKTAESKAAEQQYQALAGEV